MLVPLLTNRPTARTPRRTVDVMPSALVALGLDVPAGLDGTTFLDRTSPVDDGTWGALHLANKRADDERDAESAVA